MKYNITYKFLLFLFTSSYCGLNLCMHFSPIHLLHTSPIHLHSITLIITFLEYSIKFRALTKQQRKLELCMLLVFKFLDKARQDSNRNKNSLPWNCSYFLCKWFVSIILKYLNLSMHYITHALHYTLVLQTDAHSQRSKVVTRLFNTVLGLMPAIRHPLHGIMWNKSAMRKCST
jgi:hypothetical protein